MNSNTRRATKQDLGQIALMLRRFIGTIPTKYDLFPSFCHEFLTKLGEEHVLLVSEDETGLTGVIGGEFSVHPFNPSLTTLFEHFWWVNPESRGSGAGSMLLDAFLEAGSGVNLIIATTEPTTELPANYLAKRGLIPSERLYVKEN